MALRVPVVASNVADWIRKAATSINSAITQQEVQGLDIAEAQGNITTLQTDAVMHDGLDIYVGDTAGGSYDQTKMQAVMDALHAVSNRLK